MYFGVISLFPKMFDVISKQGIVGRAMERNLAKIELINPRDFAQGNYRRIDDRPFGGGAGMVMMAEPLVKAINYAKAQATAFGCNHCPVVYLSPQGKTLDESVVQSLLEFDGLILLCGRYDGIDERILSYIDQELSIGDYVLTGGELPAMVVMDSLIRRLPSVMGDERSVVADSFVDGLLDYPQYTKPLDFDGQGVPQVLLSGHHQNIAKWRYIAQLTRTKAKRPDLFQRYLANQSNKNEWLQEFLNDY